MDLQVKGPKAEKNRFVAHTWYQVNLYIFWKLILWGEYDSSGRTWFRVAEYFFSGPQP